MTQIVPALLIARPCVLVRAVLGAAVPLLFLLGEAVLFVVRMVAALLGRSALPRVQGIGLSIAGSFAIVIVGAVIYGFWILR